MEPHVFGNILEFVPETYPDSEGLVKQTTFDKPAGCEVDADGNLKTDGEALGYRTLGRAKRVPKDSEPADDDAGPQSLTLAQQQDLLNKWVAYHQEEDLTDESAGEIVEDA